LIITTEEVDSVGVGESEISGETLKEAVGESDIVGVGDDEASGDCALVGEFEVEMEIEEVTDSDIDAVAD